MTPITEYLDIKSIQYHRNDAGELRGRCPACHDKEESFSINENTGRFLCHRATCNIRGNSLYSLKLALNDAPAISSTSSRTYTKPPEVALTAVTPKAIAWFRNERGLTAETVAAFSVKLYKGELVFEYYRGGALQNRKYRTPDKKFRQEKNPRPTLWNADNVLAESRELVICEGEMDTMAVWQLGVKHVVSMPSGVSNLRWITEEFDWLEGFDTIFICTDMDAPGEMAANEIANRLQPYRCRRILLPSKDANQALLDGMTTEQFLEAYRTAPAMGKNMVERAEDLESELFVEEAPAIETGISRLDQALDGGFRPGVCDWTGRSGAGKTTFINQIILWGLAGDHPARALLASLEMPIPELLRTMIRQSRMFPDPRTARTFFETVTRGNLYLLNTVDALDEQTLFDCFEYAAQRLGIKVFVLDSLLRINLPLSDDANQRQKAFMSALVAFSHKYQVVVHVVCHPRKSQNDYDAVQKMDVAGSGHITDLAHSVVSIQRLEFEEAEARGYDSILRVLKNRRNGRHTTVRMRFDRQWCRFTEISGSQADKAAEN